MIFNPRYIAKREKLILAGLFLSKFDQLGLATLGFESFREAFNAIGFALGGRPASVKGYRDEFDPQFPNPRSGWHQRPLRAHCIKMLEEYGNLDLPTFRALIQSFVGEEEAVLVEPTEDGDESGSPFARRLITGLAAEQYFEAVQPKLEEFSGCAVMNTTRLGCGYDFRLRRGPDAPFLAVEVKGLREKAGSLSLTPKEHRAAGTLNDRFYLFVVKNFRESPFHELYRNPLASPLSFERKERVVVQVSWSTTV